MFSTPQRAWFNQTGKRNQHNRMVGAFPIQTGFSRLEVFNAQWNSGVIDVGFLFHALPHSCPGNNCGQQRAKDGQGSPIHNWAGTFSLTRVEPQKQRLPCQTPVRQRDSLECGVRGSGKEWAFL